MKFLNWKFHRRVCNSIMYFMCAGNHLRIFWYISLDPLITFWSSIVFPFERWQRFVTTIILLLIIIIAIITYYIGSHLHIGTQLDPGSWTTMKDKIIDNHIVLFRKSGNRFSGVVQMIVKNCVNHIKITIPIIVILYDSIWWWISKILCLIIITHSNVR